MRFLLPLVVPPFVVVGLPTVFPAAPRLSGYPRRPAMAGTRRVSGTAHTLRGEE